MQKSTEPSNDFKAVTICLWYDFDARINLVGNKAGFQNLKWPLWIDGSSGETDHLATSLKTSDLLSQWRKTLRATFAATGINVLNFVLPPLSVAMVFLKQTRAHKRSNLMTLLWARRTWDLIMLFSPSSSWISVLSSSAAEIRTDRSRPHGLIVPDTAVVQKSSMQNTLSFRVVASSSSSAVFITSIATP